MTRTVLTCLVLALACAAPAPAQDAGNAYVTAGLGFPYQAGPSGPGSEVVTKAPGGLTASWLLGGGVFLDERTSVEVELSRTGLMATRLGLRHGRTSNLERRDSFLAAGMRWHLPVAPQFRLEPIAGVVITSPTGRGQFERDPNWATAKAGTDIVIEPWQEIRLKRHVGFMGGCDLRVGGPRLAVVSSFRLSDTGSYAPGYDSNAGRYQQDRPGTHYPGGYPRWTFRSGAAVRIGF